MKKIVFALQVFSLIALLPVCVAMDMNHGKKAPTETESKKAAEKTVIYPSLFSGSITKYPIAVFAFNQEDLKPKKKNTNPACGCHPCKCGSSCTCAF